MPTEKPTSIRPVNSQCSRQQELASGSDAQLRAEKRSAQASAHPLSQAQGGQSAKTADWLVDNDVIWPVLRNCACANLGKLKIEHGG